LREPEPEPEPEQRVAKSPPATLSEQYLEALGAQSFLSLWSYPRIFRDQHGGKEICDLLVIFDREIIIFSDKHCAFKDTSRPRLDWGRWFKKAIEESAQQIWGAERWIKQYPHRLFLDQSCQNSFPLVIPPQARFYRVTVAHGAEVYAKAFGRAGLFIDPTIIGKAHYGENCEPFKVGQLDPAKGFVHVFDRTALTAVMQTIDTIQDFIVYLRDKEAVILGGKLRWAWSEQDLLAAYLGNPNEECSFTIPLRYKTIHVPTGNWDIYQRSPLRRAQERANRISYFWDELIESYSQHVLNGTLHTDTSSRSVADNERVLRLLAREPRTKRRKLSEELIEFTLKEKPGFRVIFSADQAEPLEALPARTADVSLNPLTAYVFGAIPTDPSLASDEQAHLRKSGLILYAAALKHRYPTLVEIIGIAVETKNLDPASMILSYMNTRDWGTEQEELARKVQDANGFATNLAWRRSFVPNTPPVPPIPKNPRNKPCVCGSGIKYKKCCGAGTGSARV
jgi:hypothetical protein